MKLHSLFVLALALVCAPARAQVTPGLIAPGQVLGNFGTSPAAPGPTNLMTFPVVSGNLACFTGTTGVLQDCGQSPTYIAGNVTYVESCGAKGDGIADDAGAIRNCAAQVGARNFGGKVGLSCNKTYLLASRDPLGNGIAILHPYSNVTYEGCGDSSVLKVANNMNTTSTQFAVIYPPDETSTYNYSNTQYRNFKIDFNGANNNCANTCNYQNVGIGTRYGSAVTVDNITFLSNPGSQDISFGLNSGLTVNYVTVRNSRSFNPCDQVNTACTDHSAFYAVATQFTVIGNLCSNTAPSNTSTCIEMHGVELNAVGNSDLNFAKSFNVAAQIGHTANTVTITGHTSFGAQKGVTLWALNGLTFNNVNISNSVWRRSASNINQSVAFMDFDSQVTDAGNTNLIFANNIIDGSAIAAGTADVTPVIAIGRSANTVIAGNTITGNSGECIATGTLTAASSATIMDNTLIDCGQTSNAAHKRGILAPVSGPAASFNVSNNRIANVAATYMTTGIDISLNVASGYIAPNNRIEGVVQGVILNGTGYFPYSLFGVMYSVGQGLPLTSTAAMTNGQILVGQTGAAPLPQTVSGDCTLAASGAVTCPKATLQSLALAPAATLSTTGAMMGLGASCSVTPAHTGRVKVEFIGTAANATASNVTTIKVYESTGTAPANGAATTGTQVGGPVSAQNNIASGVTPFVNGGVLTGLSPGTPYWFDLNVATSGGSASVNGVTCNAIEF